MTLIDDLERRSAVRRLASERDRRIRMVVLTDGGRTLPDELRVAANRYESGLIGDLSDDEQRLLRHLLARTSSNFGGGGSAERIRSW